MPQSGQRPGSLECIPGSIGQVKSGITCAARSGKKERRRMARYASRTQRKVMLVVAESGVFFVRAATR